VPVAGVGVVAVPVMREAIQELKMQMNVMEE